MSRLSLFSSPLLLGFEQFEQAIDRASKSADSYPPYNVEKISEHQLRITLAVAGFSMDDLSVQLEQNQLVVKGKMQADENRIFLHRGIGGRQFRKAFILADGIEVVGASMDNGLLHIDLEQPLHETEVKTIKIKARQKSGEVSGEIGRLLEG